MSTEMAAVRRERPRRAQVFAAGAGATLLALFATGCPEPADLANPMDHDKPTPAPTQMPMTEPCETTCVKEVFQIKISGCIACHTKAAPSGQLDLESEGFTQRLRDVPSKHVDAGAGAQCPQGDKLIDMANPSASWLLIKIHGMQQTCGTQMPPPPGLGANDMKCVEDYVACVTGKPSSGGGGSGGAAPSGGTGGSATAGSPGAGSGGTAAGSGGARTGGSGGTGGG